MVWFGIPIIAQVLSYSPIGVKIPVANSASRMVAHDPIAQEFVRANVIRPLVSSVSPDKVLGGSMPQAGRAHIHSLVRNFWKL